MEQILQSINLVTLLSRFQAERMETQPTGSFGRLRPGFDPSWSDYDWRSNTHSRRM